MLFVFGDKPSFLDAGHIKAYSKANRMIRGRFLPFPGFRLRLRLGDPGKIQDKWYPRAATRKQGKEILLE